MNICLSDGVPRQTTDEIMTLTGEMKHHPAGGNLTINEKALLTIVLILSWLNNCHDIQLRVHVPLLSIAFLNFTSFFVAQNVNSFKEKSYISQFLEFVCCKTKVA
jgi:hypothetical protein